MTKASLNSVKQFYRNAVPASTRLALWWSRVRLQRITQRSLAWISEPQVRDMKNRLQTFQNRYQGQRCFLMGNGPSINKTDLSLLANDYVWGVNKCFLLFDRISWRPSFYTVIDRPGAKDSAHEINDLVSQLPSTFCFFPDILAGQIVEARGNTYWFHDLFDYWTLNKVDQSSAQASRLFQQDVRGGVRVIGTVMYSVLQLAVYMGFNPIYLIGCDTEFSRSAETVSANYFDPDYIQKFKRIAMLDVEMSIYSYEIARAACDSLGVQIYNATIGGKLEVFPRVDYSTLF